MVVPCFFSVQILDLPVNLFRKLLTMNYFEGEILDILNQNLKNVTLLDVVKLI